MARKSRKNKNIAAVAQSNEVVEYTRRIPTAIYARLSDKNNSYDTTDSIDTQIKLDKKYIDAHPELELIEVFADNGFTGTNFDRPEFVRLMGKIKTGEIQCVVVKDLSRFGRNYLEAGYYIETIFPMLRARLIAVTDDFDSNRVSDRNSLTIPIKNMVNAMFAKDVSKKQVTVNEMKRRLGIHKSVVSPYGYQYSEEEKKLVKVPELAPFVDMIFKWTLAGVSRTEIARRFDLMKVPTPLEVVQSNGQYLSQKVGSWNCHMVKGIVMNPVYAGTIAMGRTRQALCYGMKKKDYDREDWVYHYDMHEAYVSKEDYEKIDASIREVRDYRKKRISENKEDREGFYDMFRCKVICGECGKPMPFALGGHSNTNTCKDFTFAFYRCISKKKISQCGNQRIQQNFLKLMVSEQIRNMIRVVCDQKELLKKIRKDEAQGNALRMVRREILFKRRKISDLENRKTSLYTDFADQVLDQEEYQFLRERTINEIQDLEAEIFAAEQKMYEMEKAIENHIAKAEELERFLNVEEISDALMEELVKEIRVYNGNRIELTFNCIDVFENELIKMCLQGEGEAYDRLIS